MKKNIIEFIMPFFWQYKIRFILTIFFLFITAAVILLLGENIRSIIDLSIATENTQNLQISLYKVMTLVIILSISGFMRSSFTHIMAQNIIKNLREKIYQNIINNSSSFFDNQKTGNITSSIISDSENLYNIFSSGFFFFIRNSLIAIGSFALLLLTNVKLTLILLLIFPTIIFPILFIGKKIKNLSKKISDSMAQISCHLNETIKGINTIKSYCLENYESLKLSKLFSHNSKLLKQKTILKSTLISAVLFLSFFIIALVLWFGGKAVINQEISSGSLSSFVFYAILLATSISGLGQISGQFRENHGSIERINNLLQGKEKIIDGEIESLPEIKKIELKRISFSYPLRQVNDIFHEKSWVFKINQKTLISGKSGIGKSTLIKLMMRFYDVNKGQILINDNIDIKNIKINKLRSLFSYIPQDCFVFSGTIHENITYGLENISQKEIEKIIANNELFSFIKKMPNKLQTEVGENGVKLSGGEKQRIAILRSLVRKSPILILDEFSSALDQKNQNYANELINEISQNKIIIIISHQKPTNIKFDQTLSLDE
jgi:ATP-binding cassette subfamily B protein